MSLIGQNDADSVCSAAGETYLPLASRYDLSVNKSWDDPSFTMASGVFTYDAPFDYGRRKVVDAMATYSDTPHAEAGKVLRIRITGGIANRKHDTENFKLYLGYKIAGVDRIAEMTWHPSPTTTYTAYTLDFIVPQVESGNMDIWFEGKYTENGVEKSVYESRNNQNFQVVVVTDTNKALCFDANWREGMKGGDLKAGESVALVYDVKRLLARMMGTRYANWPAWNAYAHFKIFDAANNVVKSGRLPLSASAFDPSSGSGSTERPSYKPILLIPKAAKDGKLVLWFEGTNRGPTVWDSDFDANYEVSIK